MMDASTATLVYFPFAEYADCQDMPSLRAFIEGRRDTTIGTIEYNVSRLQQEFKSHYAKLKQIASDATVWPEEAERPSAEALVWARLVLQQLEKDGLLPTSVVASVEGGVAICFVNGDKYSDIECLNPGTILGVTSDRRSRPTVWKIDQGSSGISRASARIRDFIYACSPDTNDPQRQTRG